MGNGVEFVWFVCKHVYQQVQVNGVRSQRASDDRHTEKGKGVSMIQVENSEERGRISVGKKSETSQWCREVK